jgi:hypothetical protein
MDDQTLIGRLGALEAPDLDGTRGRALAAIPARARSLRAARSRRRRRLVPRVAAAAIVVAAALASLTLFTAPGQAVSSWVGGRLGFGKPGEHPTLRQLRHDWVGMSGSIAAGQPAYVLARGPMPHGAHWEFITYRSDRAPRVHCFEVEIAKLRQLIGGGCEEKGAVLAAEDGLVVSGVGGNAAAGMRYEMVSGRVSPDVESVRIAFDGRPVPVDVEEPPPALLEELGFRHPFKVFAAFPTGTGRGGTLTVAAMKGGVAVARAEPIELPGTLLLDPKSMGR